MRILRAILPFLALLLVTPVFASTLVDANTDSGWFDSTGSHEAGNSNYLSGNDANYHGDGTLQYNNYFAFSLSGVSGNVTSATLNLYTFLISGSGTYTIYETALTPSQVDSSQPYSGATTIYSDLTSGPSIGSIALTHGDAESYISITLNSTGLAWLTSEEGSGIVIGGSYPQPSSSYDSAFGFTGYYPTNNLTITTETVATPEPGTVTLFAIGLFGLFGVVRWKKFGKNA
jgi:hypothetical protein